MTTQLDCSIGIKKESAFGTYEAPDQFAEFLTEGLDANLEFYQGSGIRVGARVARGGDRRGIAMQNPGGPIEFEAPSSGLGAYLEAVFGSVTNNEVPTDTDVYQQVHTPATSDDLPSYTIQKGIPPVGGGSTHPVSFLGMMCNSLEFSAAAGEIVKIVSEWMGKETITSESYESPSYPTDLQLFHFVHGSIYIGNTITKATTTALASASGSAAGNVRDFSLKYANNLDGAGHNLGGAGKLSRKKKVGLAEITGNITAEYDSATLRDAHLNNTPLSLLLEFQAPTEIATGLYPVLQIHVPEIRLEGDIPKANGGDVITQSIPFVGLDSLAASTEPIYVVYRTTDTAP